MPENRDEVPIIGGDNLSSEERMARHAIMANAWVAAQSIAVPAAAANATHMVIQDPVPEQEAPPPELALVEPTREVEGAVETGCLEADPVEEEEEEEGELCPSCLNHFPELCEECEDCLGCCTCSQCPGCSSTIQEGQECCACRQCNDCCSCPYCEGCDHNVDEECYCSDCSNCSDCCTCVRCVSCGTAQEAENICSLCSSCTDHCCSCQTCEGCDDLHRASRMCSICSRCRNCCQEEGCNRTVPFIEREEPFFWEASAKKNEFKKNKSKRFMSVEIEVADAQNDSISTIVRKWKAAIVRDGSLPDTTGFEICTAPANGDLLIKQIEEICAWLADSEASISAACGLHVHADARDFSYWNIRNLLRLYVHLEDDLFAMLPYSRRNGGEGKNFCRRCKTVYGLALNQQGVREWKKHIHQSIYPYDKGVQLTSRKKEKYYDKRYDAMKLHSWFMRGTVEARMHSGTINQEKIINWTLLWAAIMDFACTANSQKMDEMIGIPDGASMLDELAPNKPIKEWIKKRTRKFKRNNAQDEELGS